MLTWTIAFTSQSDKTTQLSPRCCALALQQPERRNNTLVGGLGNDTLTEGSGADHFMFESKTQGIDRITDFNNIQDKIAIKASGFGGGLIV